MSLRAQPACVRSEAREVAGAHVPFVGALSIVIPNAILGRSFPVNGSSARVVLTKIELPRWSEDGYWHDS
jgi:hypothetical protein